MRAPGQRAAAQSRFVVDDLKFGHFTVTDVKAGQFHFSQKIQRGAFGEAGFGDAKRPVWLGEWSLGLESDGSMKLRANDRGRVARFATGEHETVGRARRGRREHQGRRAGTRVALLLRHADADARDSADRQAARSPSRARAGSTTSGRRTNSRRGSRAGTGSACSSTTARS